MRANTSFIVMRPHEIAMALLRLRCFAMFQNEKRIRCNAQIKIAQNNCLHCFDLLAKIENSLKK